MSHHVYRLYDKDDRLLYVGVTSRPVDKRIKEHGYRHWWPDVRRYESESYDTRAEALTTEAHAIKNDKPLHNLGINAPSQRTPRVPQTFEASGLQKKELLKRAAAAAKAAGVAHKRVVQAIDERNSIIIREARRGVSLRSLATHAGLTHSAIKRIVDKAGRP